jgi:hypothetical protein
VFEKSACKNMYSGFSNAESHKEELLDLVTTVQSRRLDRWWVARVYQTLHSVRTGPGAHHSPYPTGVCCFPGTENLAAFLSSNLRTCKIYLQPPYSSTAWCLDTGIFCFNTSLIYFRVLIQVSLSYSRHAIKLSNMNQVYLT